MLDESVFSGHWKNEEDDGEGEKIGAESCHIDSSSGDGDGSADSEEAMSKF